MWRPRPDLLNLAGIQVSSAGVKVKSGGVVEADSGRTCCCQDGCTSGKICVTEYHTTLSCDSSTFSTPTAVGNKCVGEGTTLNTWTAVGGSFVDPCLYRMYVPVEPTQCCSVDGDCTTTATAPPTPSSYLPLGNCCPTACDCSHGIPPSATVGLAGVVSCTACFPSADNTASAIVTAGTVNGTYTLSRDFGVCAYSGSFAGPTYELYCASGVCAGAIDTTFMEIKVRLVRTGVNTWRVTCNAKSGGFVPATFYFDSGNFAWVDACTGGSSGGNNIFTNCVNTATGGGGSCAQPDHVGHDGTCTATLG